MPQECAPGGRSERSSGRKADTNLLRHDLKAGDRAASPKTVIVCSPSWRNRIAHTPKLKGHNDIRRNLVGQVTAGSHPVPPLPSSGATDYCA
jgi:hypothetical protein